MLRCPILLTCIISSSEDGRGDGSSCFSRGEVAIIRAEIERLEMALRECTDAGIQDQIKAWIEEEKKKLREDSK